METSTQTSNSGFNNPIIATQAANLTRAIFQHESNTNYNATGDAGTSKGAGQWQPETWASEAQQVLGNKDAPMTPQNQNVVAQAVIRHMITPVNEGGLGYNAAQVAATWNSGSPDNWENKVGKTKINGQTISYNVPQYVKAVTDLYQQFKNKSIPEQQFNPNSTQSNTEETNGIPLIPFNASRAPQETQNVAPAQEGFIPRAAGILNTIFPGSSTVGNFVGTQIAELEHPQQAAFINQTEPAPSIGKTLAAAGELGLEAAAPAIGGGSSALGRIGLQTALGAGIGGLNAAATGNNILGGAAAGGLTGGALGAAFEGLSGALSFLPKWIYSTQLKGVNPEDIQNVLGSKIGSASSFAARAQNQLNSIGDNMDTILSNSNTSNALISGNEVHGLTLAGDPTIPGSGLPGSNLSQSVLRKVLNILVGKTKGELVDKLFPPDGSQGSLTIEEAHELAAKIGKRVAKNFSNISTSPENKEVGAKAYFALQDLIKQNLHSPEYNALSDEYAKTVNVSRGLSKLANKSQKIGLMDIVSALAGGSTFGVPGAIGGLALERLARSPGTELSAANLISRAGNALSTPIARGITGFTGANLAPRTQTILQSLGL